jgi:hypothetical protein
MQQALKTEGGTGKNFPELDHKLSFFVSPRDWPICKPDVECSFFAPSGYDLVMISSTINGIRIASVCLIGYWLALFVGTHLPARIPDMPGANDDKILHVIAFAGLSFLLSLGHSDQTQRSFSQCSLSRDGGHFLRHVSMNLRKSP